MTTQAVSSLYFYSANITSYNAATKIATLSTPISASIGWNQYQGDVCSQYSIQGTLTNIASAITAGKPAQLSTDEQGNFLGLFNVPPSMFHVGSRIFRVDNRTVQTDETTATTYAEATFTAAGLSGTSQNADFSPSVDSSSINFTQSSQLQSSIINSNQTAYDPIAQTFMISSETFPNGAFLYSLKLFFASKPTTNSPISVSIIPTLNGYPNGSALDYSTVMLNSNQVITSSSPQFLDSTTYTEFMFDAPVYVQSGVLYAIMIKANSPDYTLYYAQQNQIAIPSTAKATPNASNPTNPTKIGAAPYIGALFESQNSITWTADQTKDLMFVLDQCVFNTAVAPSVQFVVPGKLPFRKMGTQDIKHKINYNNVSNTLGNYSKSRKYDAINVTTTDFVPSETSINYAYQSTLLSTNNTTAFTSINPGKFGSPTPDNIYLNDGSGERVLIKSSNSSFSLIANMASSDPNVSPVISDDGTSLYTVKYLINNMGIGNNVISITNAGLGYNVNTATISISTPNIGSNTAVLGLTANANGAITKVYTISAGSGYLTAPTVTITGANTSQANVVIQSETGASGGNAWSKYFTKKVVLTPGNDSGDLRVYYTAYQPLGSQVYIYYKILSSQDTSTFESINWQLMTCVNNYTAYSTSRTNLIEYECAPGIFTSNHANNSISYTNASGQTYNNFIQFAIKVVLATSDPTNVPFLTDIRAIALPEGTGI